MRFFADPVGNLLELAARHGPIAAFADGDAALVCAFGEEHHRTVLTDARRFATFAESPIPAPAGSAAARLGHQLVTQNGEQHQLRRRMMMPVFAKSAVERYRDATVQEVERRRDRFSPGSEIDAALEIADLTLSIAMRALFGLDVAGEGGELASVGVEYLGRMIDPLGMLFPVDFPGTPYRRYLRAAARLDERIRGLIEQRSSMPPASDVLSLLTRARDQDGTCMSETELVAQAALLFVAGYETTANTLAWTLLLLGLHGDAMAWLDEELAGLAGRAPGVADLASLPRLDAVVRESMRLLPAVPFLFMRRAVEPVALGGHELPAGAVVCLSPLVAHRDPVLFRDPMRFDPTRWVDLRPGPYAYLPFGAGPRACLGASFAGQTIRLVLATLLQWGHPAIPNGATISRKVRGITLGVAHGMPMRFVRRGARLAPAILRGDLHALVRLPQAT